MAIVGLVDGTVLTVTPVPVLGRDEVPYEVSLRLLRDGQPFGEVGERCGYFLGAALDRLHAARLAGADFPMSSLEVGVRAWAADADLDAHATWTALARYLPRDRELFSFRSRDPDDLATVGELTLDLRVERTFADGRWSHRTAAVLEAWGEAGVGLRAVLTSDQVLGFLEALVEECAQAVAAAAPGEAVGRPVV